MAKRGDRLEAVAKTAAEARSGAFREPGPAAFRTDWRDSRGRRFPESESPARTPFQRDRDRVVHASAFRRLKGKTQVFLAHEGDHYRTRLTHSLEVSQIARSVARRLGLDEDLAECLALAHDVGHPPFGHAGEDALDEAMRDFGGFDHNAQTLKALTLLEIRYPRFDGLNLCWETLEGLVKHNGPLRGSLAAAKYQRKNLPDYIVAFDAEFGLGLDSFAGPEAQIAALADDIAYNNHDIDDGLRAGLFAVGDLAELPLVGPVFAETGAEFPDIAPERVIAEAIRRLIGIRVDDLVAESARRAAHFSPRSADEVRALPEPLIAFSPAMHAHEQELRRFLFTRMYRHWKVNRMMSRARRVVRELFGLLLAEPDLLPPRWAARTSGAGAQQTAATVCDYIAGMTDAFCLSEHKRLLHPD